MKKGCNQINIYSRNKIIWLDCTFYKTWTMYMYSDNHWRQYQCDHYDNDFDNDDEDDYKPLAVIMKRIQGENHSGPHPAWE